MSFSKSIIIVGSGIGGLSCALKLAELGHRVTILTKKEAAQSNTNYAQGGIACVMDDQGDFEAHVQDTIAAGSGLCNKEVVRIVVHEGRKRVRELIDWGVEFCKTHEGVWNFGKEGGHSERRILHVKDITGKAIECALLEAVRVHKNIELYEHTMVIDLITCKKIQPKSQDFGVCGLYALDVHSRKIRTWQADAVVLATGGAGQVYLYTTNPEIATGDGIAIGHRAGAQVSDMEFMQFHPTALYSHGGERCLISEAVRGEGAVLRDFLGRAFMQNYHPQADLAPRDIVARAIDEELKKSGSNSVFLDITHKPLSFWETNFPNMVQVAKKIGIDLQKGLIPVVPAAHYLCGGLVTDMNGQTDVSGLYACGEVACTGLHGANRLASNSLLEAVVMAHRVAIDINQSKRHIDLVNSLPKWNDGNVHDSNERVMLTHDFEELKRTLWDYVGIARTRKRLLRAKARVDELKREVDEYYWNFKVDEDLLELRNLVVVAELIIEAALARKESVGLHWIQNC
jgi:L-aspartate oxidase